MKQSITPETSSDDVVHEAGATRSFLAGVTLLGISAVGALLIIRGFEFFQTAMGVDSFALTFLVGGGLATLWLAIVGAAYLKFRPVEIHYGVRWPTLRDAGWIVGGTVFAVVVSLLIEIAVIPFREGGATNISSAAAVENPVLIYTIFLVGNLVFIAPVEEFLYRGVIQGRLRESFGPLAAISITSIGFALSHIPSYWFGGSDLFSVAVGGALLGIAAAGLILGAIYERTQSILLVSIVHGLLNSIGIALALVALL